MGQIPQNVIIFMKSHPWLIFIYISDIKLCLVTQCLINDNTISLYLTIEQCCIDHIGKKNMGTPGHIQLTTSIVIIIITIFWRVIFAVWALRWWWALGWWTVTHDAITFHRSIYLTWKIERWKTNRSGDPTAVSPLAAKGQQQTSQENVMKQLRYCQNNNFSHFSTTSGLKCV